MDKEMVQAMRQLLAEEREPTSRMLLEEREQTSRMFAEEREHTSRMIDEKLAPIFEELAEIKEHAEVTRSTTNSLVAWAENVGVFTQVEFPVRKVKNG